MPDLKTCVETNRILRTPISKLPSSLVGHIKYGYETEIFLSWLSFKILTWCPEVCSLLLTKSKSVKKSALTDETCLALTALANKDVVYSQGVPHICGTIIHADFTFTLSHVKTCIALVCGVHPLIKLCRKHHCSGYTVNVLDMLDPKTIFATVDFPITSIQNLMLSLGDEFQDSTSFVDKGYLLVCSAVGIIVFYGKSMHSYKVLSAPVFSELYAKDLLSVPLDERTKLIHKIIEEDE